MKPEIKKAAGVAGSVVILGSMSVGVPLALAQADDGQATSPSAAATAQAEGRAVDHAEEARVMGEFAFSQGEVTPTATIAKALAKAPQYLCAGQALESAPSAKAAVGEVGDWAITVDGAVQTSFTATIDEIRSSSAVQKLVMGCSCSGNPADGQASVNAEVTGAAVTVLLNAAVPTAEANTVVFGSADGYEVALPLSYIMQRYCPIVFAVNGSPLAESVGGTNQLWLGGTSARYFARDIVSITLEERETPPPAPGSDAAEDEYANLPNIGIAFGGTVA